MSSVEEILRQVLKNPQDVRFTDLCKICDYYFGEPRQRGAHHIYKTPWRGDPRINIQDDNGKAKTYQVKQVIKAIEKLEAENGNKK
jgi:predicted RNA binding protein YcfA (HicA-like mRNA interferase family)